MDRKEQIMLATLALASEAGLSNVSLAQIAQRVGIRKASLYNHFASKEEIVSALYEYLRAQSQKQLATSFVDIGALIRNRTALEVLTAGVKNYRQLVESPELKYFYRLILSERVFSGAAADILRRETERMILSTKQLFYALQVHGLMRFDHIDETALSYAMTVHGLIEYSLDLQVAGIASDDALLQGYLQAFCAQYACPKG